MRSTPGKIEHACQEQFSQTAEIAMPRLMKELENPGRVALLLKVGQNATREWYLQRGWCYDAETKKWVEPELEQSRA